MRILITGASGCLGAYLLHALQGSRHDVIAWSGTNVGTRFGFPLRAFDLAQPIACAAALRETAPEVVIHTAAIAALADCRFDPARASAVNNQGTAALAESAAAIGARFVFTSTDLVFDGNKGDYAETDAPKPLSHYGVTKVAAEQACLALPRTLVVRLSLMFGPGPNERPSFFDQQLEALRTRTPLHLFEDEWRTPLSLSVAARALLALAEADGTGLLHVGGPERMSRLDMGRRLAEFIHEDPSVFRAVQRDDRPAAEPRPRDTSLNCGRWRDLFPRFQQPTYEAALWELLGERQGSP